MHYLKNDYSEGCHPKIMEALTRTNLESTTGYGLDEYCLAAQDKIRQVFSCPQADVHFLVGGTQANMTFVAHTLRPYESAIAASTGHINTHESGAVESTGHKIISYPHPEGKVTPQMIEMALEETPDEHTTEPKLVYISDSTEIGTIYTKSELIALHQVCQAHDLYLYLDGARLGCALTSPENDIQPEDLAKYCDAFYIGGTKNGALFGEAMVIVNENLKRQFRISIKQRGGMLAKGRLLGLQFLILFEDGLWFDLARHANTRSAHLQDELEKKGVQMLVHSPTNQIFPIFSNEEVARLGEKFAFETWGKVDDDHTVIRLVCSWATTEEPIAAFLRELK